MASARHLTALLALLGALIVATGCNLEVNFGDGIDGSGDLVTERFDFDDFDSIDVSGTFDAFVTVGEAASVEVLIDDNLADELDVRVRNGELQVAMKNGVSVDSGTLEATITLPELARLDVSGASSANVIDNTATSQRFSVSGASDVNVTTSADDIWIEVSGSSDFAMSGTARSLVVEASGASDLNLDLEGVNSAEVDLSGASSLELLSGDEITGSISGASDLTVPAGARTDIDSSGASEVRRR